MTVDPANGNRGILSNSVTGTGPAFSSLEGVAVDAADNILVVDAGLGAVFVVDPANGNRTILSDAVTGTGTGSRRMTTLRRRCNDYPPVAGMLDRVDECIAAGNVKESGWEFRGNDQKYQGAYWTLIFLADMRADGRDPHARLLAKHILAAQLDTGGFSCNGRPRYEVVCLTANILRTLVHFGLGDDECVAHGYRRLAERILPLRERNAR